MMKKRMARMANSQARGWRGDVEKRCAGVSDRVTVMALARLDSFADKAVTDSSHETSPAFAV